MKINRDSVNFECADCGEPLLVLKLTAVEGIEKSKTFTQVVVKCILCGGFSYVQQIIGQFYPGAPSDQMLFDVLDDIDGAPKADVLFKAWRR